MTRPPFAVPDVGPVADDDGGGPVGMSVQAAVPAPEHRLALAVIRAPVSAAWASAGDVPCGGTETVGMPSLAASSRRSLSDVSDGRLGEAFVEFSLGLGILAWVFDGAAGGSHHADGMEALDGDELGLGF